MTTLNVSELTDKLLAGLLELEQSGDIVITHPSPHVLAELLGTTLIHSWAAEFLDEPPSEIVIEGTLNSAAKYLKEYFGIDESLSRQTVDNFLRGFRGWKSLREVAELVSHQGTEEIALGAYYCVHQKRGEYYSADYLDWRKEYYAHNRQR